ncbi:hypothetical protein [Bradyrhizobium sp. USDA 4454]
MVEDAQKIGYFSSEHVGALKCRACHAVAGDQSNADALIEAAREVIHAIDARWPARSKEVSSHLHDLWFIELTHLDATKGKRAGTLRSYGSKSASMLSDKMQKRSALRCDEQNCSTGFGTQQADLESRYCNTRSDLQPNVRL